MFHLFKVQLLHCFSVGWLLGWERKERTFAQDQHSEWEMRGTPLPRLRKSKATSVFQRNTWIFGELVILVICKQECEAWLQGSGSSWPAEICFWFPNSGAHFGHVSLQESFVDRTHSFVSRNQDFKGSGKSVRPFYLSIWVVISDSGQGDRKLYGIEVERKHSYNHYLCLTLTEVFHCSAFKHLSYFFSFKVCLKWLNIHYYIILIKSAGIPIAHKWQKRFCGKAVERIILLKFST